MTLSLQTDVNPQTAISLLVSEKIIRIIPTNMVFQGTIKLDTVVVAVPNFALINQLIQKYKAVKYQGIRFDKSNNYTIRPRNVVCIIFGITK